MKRRPQYGSVDLPLSLHQALTDLAQQRGSGKRYWSDGRSLSCPQRMRRGGGTPSRGNKAVHPGHGTRRA
ncbi:MAG: hypothetical protein K6T90_07080 [Leptolyngbyaceae cyanobacterium HOT.MB2.61]|nr:hypothetical protein [Leptolyngbyaceae cyanobacterium HOT.MB2.61]